MTLTVKGGTVVKGPLRVGSIKPTDIAGCQWWLDAADIATITSWNGNRCAAIRDKASNYSFSQGELSAKRPVYTNTKNGKTYLTMVGADNTALNTGSTASLKNVSGLSMFVVGNTSSTNAQQYLFWMGQGGSATRLALRFDSTNKVTVFGYRADDADLWILTSDNAWGTGWGCFSCTFTYGSYASLYGNGALLTAPTIQCSSANSSNTNSKSSNLGNLILSQYLTGGLGEIIVYGSALSDANRQAVEAYLMTKWGIA